jgi:hypothetical protein
VNGFYFDASAAGKRYAPERGTDLVNLLFESITADQRVLLTPAIGGAHRLRSRNGHCRAPPRPDPRPLTNPDAATSEGLIPREIRQRPIA